MERSKTLLKKLVSATRVMELAAPLRILTMMVTLIFMR